MLLLDLLDLQELLLEGQLLCRHLMLMTQEEETKRRISQQSDTGTLRQHMQTGKADFPVRTSLEVGKPLRKHMQVKSQGSKCATEPAFSVCRLPINR